MFKFSKKELKNFYIREFLRSDPYYSFLENRMLPKITPRFCDKRKLKAK